MYFIVCKNAWNTLVLHVALYVLYTYIYTIFNGCFETYLFLKDYKWQVWNGLQMVDTKTTQSIKIKKTVPVLRKIIWNIKTFIKCQQFDIPIADFY